MDEHIFPINMNECIESLKTNDTSEKESISCTILCCPCKAPLLLVFVLPCTLYNICMNKFNKKYIC
jgi:hypothetical protein